MLNLCISAISFFDIALLKTDIGGILKIHIALLEFCIVYMYFQYT